MKVIFSILLSIALLQVCAQKDSTAFFIKELNKKNLPDSLKAWYNIRLGEAVLFTNPYKAIDYSLEANKLAGKLFSSRLLYYSLSNLTQIYNTLGQGNKNIYYAELCLSNAQKMQNQEFIYNSLNLLGNAYLDAYKLPEAVKIFVRALNLVETNKSIPGRLRIYVNMGSYYYRNNDFKKGLDILSQAKAIAQKNNKEDDIMLVYESLGQMYSLKGRIDSVQYYLFTALDFYYKKKDVRNQAKIHQILGITYGNLFNMAKMEEYLNKSYTGFASYGASILAANSLMLQVPYFFRSFQFKKCLELLNIAEPFFMQYDHKPSMLLVHIYRAGLLNIIGDTLMAKRHFNSATELAATSGSPVYKKLILMTGTIMEGTRKKIELGDTSLAKEVISLKDMVASEQIKSTLETLTANKAFVKKNRDEIIEVIKEFHDTGTQKKMNYDSLINLPMDSTIAATYNKQLQDIETKYHTRQKDDSIQLQTQLIDFKTRSIKTRNYLLAGLLFLAIGVFLLFLRSRKQERRIAQQYGQIQQLQSELTHRTANFFNSIKGMLTSAFHTTSDKETISSLDKRVGTINSLFKTLYSSPDNQSSFGQLLESICRDFERSFGEERGIKIYCRSDADIQRSESIPLAYIIMELLTNADKYAFGNGGGDINVNISKEAGGRVLHVWDTGLGKDESKVPRKGSQGMNIIKSYAKNLDGSISTWNENGFHFKMEF